MKKVKNILLIILFTLFFLFEFIIFAMNLYTKAPAKDSIKKSSQAFVIPWSNRGFIAQGITYDAASDNFYLTGYMKDGSASPILIVNKTSGKFIKAIRMTFPDGSDFTGHAGGITLFEGDLYIAGSSFSCFYLFDKTLVDSAAKGSSVPYKTIVDLKNAGDKIKVAYCTSHEGLIYAGEFYRDPQYLLAEEHQVQTEDGIQRALAVGFEVSPEGSTTAKIAYSTPIQIQGMCFDGDYIYLTSSWGLGKSYVYKYNLNKIAQSATKQVCGQDVPLYHLTMSNMEECYILPPMAEEIECVDGLFYINNESASNKYIFGKFTGGRWCRAYKFN